MLWSHPFLRWQRAAPYVKAARLDGYLTVVYTLVIIASEGEAETALRLPFDRAKQLYKTKCFYMKTVLNVKINRDIKIRAQKTAAKLGLPLSLVVGEHLRRFAAEETITFAAPKKMSKKLERWIAEAERDLTRGKNVSPVFNTMDGAIEWLHS